jgi:hypothetical protein
MAKKPMRPFITSAFEPDGFPNRKFTLDSRLFTYRDAHDTVVEVERTPIQGASATPKRPGYSALIIGGGGKILASIDLPSAVADAAQTWPIDQLDPTS